MAGRVRLGKKLGRTLGYPTANLALQRKVVPLWGIFAVRVSGQGWWITRRCRVSAPVRP